MDRYGWLADELTELWEQLEEPELKPDADDVQRLLQLAIEASNLACRKRRKRAEASGELSATTLAPSANPAGARRRAAAPRRTRFGPEVAPGPAPFALGFA
jgi:hypothetical protein